MEPIKISKGHPIKIPDDVYAELAKRREETGVPIAGQLRRFVFPKKKARL